MRVTLPGLLVTALAVLGGVLLSVPAHSAARTTHDQGSFDMVRSAAAAKAKCLAGAHGEVTITRGSQNDVMEVQVERLPANTGFDLFVLQLPNAPFGVAWYQSDLQTDSSGHGEVTVQGIFNAETFSLSLGGPSGGANPTENVTGKAVNNTTVVFRPTHQFHLGLWFNSPDDAAKAGCPGTVTPFNGEQHAGIQALSTRNFAVNAGPLQQVQP